MAIEREFGQLLSSLTTLRSLSSALPTFVVWKDCGRKTKEQQSVCPAVSRPGMVCACPKRLAFGTVDSLIGKVRAIFVEHGRGSEWHSLLGVGNPTTCRWLKAYLADVWEEQLRARITLCQAEPSMSCFLRETEQQICCKSRYPTFYVFPIIQIFYLIMFGQTLWGQEVQTFFHSKGAQISRFVQCRAWKYILTFVNYSE